MNTEANKRSKLNGLDLYKDYLAIRHNNELAEHGTLGFKCAISLNTDHLSFAIYYCDQFSFMFNIWNKISSMLFAFIYSCNHIRPGILLYNLNREFCINHITNNIYKIIGLTTINFYFSHIITSCTISILYDLFFFDKKYLTNIQTLNIYLINPILFFSNSDIITINYITEIISKKNINIHFYILSFIDINISENLKFLKKIGSITVYNFIFNIHTYKKIYSSSLFHTRTIYLYSIVFGKIIDCINSNIQRSNIEFKTNKININDIITIENKYTDSFIKNIEESCIYSMCINMLLMPIFIHDYFISFLGLCNFNIYYLKNRSLLIYFFSSSIIYTLLLLTCYLIVFTITTNTLIISCILYIYSKLSIFATLVSKKLIMW